MFLSYTWHISALFQRRELDTRCRAISIERNRSDRRSSTSVYRKFIRSHRHVTAARFEEDRQSLVASVVAGARKWKLLDIASIMVRRARQMARGGERSRKVAEPDEEQQTNAFFIGQHWSTHKNVIAPSGWNPCSSRNFRPRYVTHSQSRREWSALKRPARNTATYDFSLASTFHIEDIFSYYRFTRPTHGRQFIPDTSWCWR